MAFALGDRVKETSTTTGTGDVTLAGAAAGYRSFASVLSVGDTTWYAVALGADWEVGLGTLTAATTLQRTTVLASSNGGALTSFGAGSKEVFVTTPATALAQLRALRSSFRQRIVNGNFAINQRGVAAASTAYAAGAYTVDRWKAGAGGLTMSLASSGPDTTPTISAGTLVQVIEGGFSLTEGGNYVLSWTGTAQARINGGSYAASPIAVTGLTAGANATVEFGTGTVGLVQFEPNVTGATPFERGHDEMRRCQRYFSKSYPTGLAPGAVDNAGACALYLNYTSASAGFFVRKSEKLTAEMRVSPTITFYSPKTGAAGKAYDEANNADVNALLFNQGTASFAWQATVAAATSNLLFSVHYTASAEL